MSMCLVQFWNEIHLCKFYAFRMRQHRVKRTIPASVMQQLSECIYTREKEALSCDRIKWMMHGVPIDRHAIYFSANKILYFDT